MNSKVSGWFISIAAMGMMCTLLAGDIGNLKSWGDTLYPAFFSGVLMHIGAVIAAFVGGNLVPNIFRDRSNDLSASTLNNLKNSGVN